MVNCFDYSIGTIAKLQKEKVRINIMKQADCPLKAEVFLNSKVSHVKQETDTYRETD